jgi:uncharacterized membrane protein
MMKSIRKWLLAGLLVIVPLGITIWVLEWIVSSLDKTLLILPASWHPDKILQGLFPGMNLHIPGFGVILAFAILLVVGAVASNFFGKKLVGWGDSLLNRIPVVRSIYSSVKQVSDTLFSDGGNAFRKAVLIQWPREGVWTIAFVTGAPGGDVVNHLHGEYVSVYVPTTPNPTGGYFVMLKKSDCTELNMSVDEALKYIVSMGVVAPGAQAPAPQNTAPLAS